MSDLISDSEKWINIEATEKYRLRKANYPELEARLFLWFKDALKEKIPLCDDLVIEQAKIIGTELKIHSSLIIQLGDLEDLKSAFKFICILCMEIVRYLLVI